MTSVSTDAAIMDQGKVQSQGREKLGKWCGTYVVHRRSFMGNFVCPVLDPWVSWFKSSFAFSKCDLIVLSEGFSAKISYKVVFQGSLSPEEKSQVRALCRGTGCFSHLVSGTVLCWLTFQACSSFQLCCPFYLCQHFYLDLETSVNQRD